MNTIYVMPLEWYVARIEYLNRRLAEIPNMYLGYNSGVSVIRVYENGKRKCEISIRSKRWGQFHLLMEKRICIEEEIRTLRDEMLEFHRVSYGDAERYLVVTSQATSCAMLNGVFFDSLVENECSYPKETEYFHEGRGYRSKFELSIAQVLNELGIEYKYEVGIVLAGVTVYPDFVLYFPEINRVVILEALGCLDRPDYFQRCGAKIQSYRDNGILYQRDLFVLCADSKYMPNSSELRCMITGIVRRVYSQHIRIR